MKNTVYVICDAHQDVGYGHFFRCFALLNAMAQVTDLSVTWSGCFDDRILTILQDTSLTRAVELAESPGQLPASLMHSHSMPVLIDTYLLNQREITVLADRHQVVAIDDFAPHDFAACLAVVNFCLQATTKHYASQHQFLGCRYFITRSEIDAVRQARLAQIASCDLPQRVLIAIGGHDRFQIGPQIATALASTYQGLSITLVGDYPPLDKAIIQRRFVSDMATEYASADLVICGGGLIKYEAAFCLIPTLVVSQTAEQQQETDAFSAAGLCIDMGPAEQWQADVFVSQIKDLLSQPARLHTTVAQSQAVFCSGSTATLAEALVHLWEPTTHESRR